MSRMDFNVGSFGVRKVKREFNGGIWKVLLRLGQCPVSSEILVCI